MQMNYEKDGKYEKLYPKTISSNVEMLDGRDLNTWKQDFEDEFNVISDKLNEWEGTSLLWEGSEVLGSSDERIYPSKLLSECKTGWILVFARTTTTSVDNINYYHIPKIHLDVGAFGIRVLLGSIGNRSLSKFIYTHNDRLSGHASNITDGNDAMSIIAVYEY